jgi:2-polyprenyl-3-methyl-5-hydroxy-6-metoxy-1,4-benzoquinol methylase
MEKPMSLNYYDEKGQDFFDRTVHLDIHELYDLFAEYLPKGASILDAGCGSGRDSKAFMERGYKLSAFDGSATMAKLASEFTGLEVKHQRFAEMAYQAEFEAIWANATLLHVPYKELADIFSKFIAALKHHGLWFMSFKLGTGERTDDFERHFTNFTEARYRDFIAQFPDLEIEKLIITSDQRKGHEGEKWLNAILRKV